MTLKIAQIKNLKEIKDRLCVLELSMKKAEIERVKPREETKLVEAFSSDESSDNLESMSDRDYQAMILEHAKESHRQLIDQYFKRENAFKTSLSQTEKKKFDTDVKKVYAKLLTGSGVDGGLSSFDKKTLRRGSESMPIADLCVKDSIDRQDALAARSVDRREEKIRLWHEEFLARIE